MTASLVPLACGRCGVALAPRDGEVVVGCACGAAWRGTREGLVEQAVLRASATASAPWWAFGGPPTVTDRTGGSLLGVSKATWAAGERIWVPAWAAAPDDVVARAMRRTRERGEPVAVAGSGSVAGVTREPAVARRLARFVVVAIEADAASLTGLRVTLPDAAPELWLLDE